MEEKNERKTKRRNDIILIGALLLIAAIGLIYLFFFRGTGDTVKVTVDGCCCSPARTRALVSRWLCRTADRWRAWSKALLSIMPVDSRRC